MKKLKLKEMNQLLKSHSKSLSSSLLSYEIPSDWET